MKQALLDIAAALGTGAAAPNYPRGWGELATRPRRQGDPRRRRDTQVSRSRRRPASSSIPGRSTASSGRPQPAEMGWGTHERGLPPDGSRHEFGCGARSISIAPGWDGVRTWTPLEGPYPRLPRDPRRLISISDYFSFRTATSRHRPTVHYAYHPCDPAVLSLHESQARTCTRKQTAPHGGDHRWHGRAWCAADGSRAPPIGTARSSTYTKRASWRPTTTRPRCRSARRYSRRDLGDRNPARGSSSPRRSTSAASWRSACRTSGGSSATSATGRR